MQELIHDPLFQALFNAPVPRIIVRADAPLFTIVISNDAHKFATNLIGKEIDGKSVWEIFDPDQAGGDGGLLLSDALTQAQLTYKTVLMPPFRYDMSSPDNIGMVEKWWQLEIMPIGESKDHPNFLLTTTHDITDQVFRERHIEDGNKKLEELNALLEERVAARTRELTLSEKKLRTLVDQSPVAIALLTGKDRVFDSVNKEMLKILGKDDDIIGKPLSVALPRLKQRTYADILNVFDTGTPYGGKETELKVFTDGSWQTCYFNIISYPIKTSKYEVESIIVVANDITDQVKARKELERIFEQANLSKQAAQLGTFDMDLLNGTMEWDARCRELFGISHGEEVSYENDFLTGLHPEDRERIFGIITKLFDRSQSDGIYDVEYRTVGAEDNKVRWVRAKGKVYFGENDKPVRFIGSVLDISDKKQEEQLRNDFIGMASHELKTPLTTLQAYIQLLSKKKKDTGDRLEVMALKQAEKQILKMGNMISGFLNLSRLESGKLYLNHSVAEIRPLILEVIDEMRLIHPDFDIQLLNDEKVQADMDSEKISHVVSNLLSNAVKFSEKGKAIQVTYFTDGEILRVSVQDEGPGISKKDAEHIFSRYYRVQEPGKKYVSGFGIGLYLSYEIIQLHHGRLWVESEPGRGSAFIFELPLVNPLP